MAIFKSRSSRRKTQAKTMQRNRMHGAFRTTSHLRIPTALPWKPGAFKAEAYRCVLLCVKQYPAMKAVMPSKDNSYSGKSNAALMQICREMIKRKDLGAMGTLLVYLKLISEDFEVSDMIEMLANAIIELVGNSNNNEPNVTRDSFRTALITLMEMSDGDGRPLFKRQTHWMAVMRVAVDVKLVGGANYTAFKRFIESLKIGELRIPINVKLLSRLYQGVYAKPLRAWSWEAYCKQSQNSVHPKSYTEMEAVAKNLDSLVHTLAQAS